MVVNKSKSAFKTIAEVAEELGVATHVLRFWETKFAQIKPMKATGGRRYYRPDDVEILKLIKGLLYGERYTIEGAQQLIKEKGLKNLLGEEEIQKDFFEAEKDSSVEVAPVKAFDTELVQKITDAVSDLKNLRAKLANL
ncbi:MAG: MerR family transcriptional regulator [Alphaproteobacteria bacterium]|nr:MerR family transcriptional regulator [Alphaproteobacteria bacterium]